MKMPLVVLSAVFIVTVVLMPAVLSAETASCRHEQKGAMTQCMEFSSKGALPGPLRQVCEMDGSGKWKSNDPCPKDGLLGTCKVTRTDDVTQLVCCYKRADVPDKSRVEFCRQSCKGTFTKR